jgi:hypothetical protein
MWAVWKDCKQVDSSGDGKAEWMGSYLANNWEVQMSDVMAVNWAHSMVDSSVETMDWLRVELTVHLLDCNWAECLVSHWAAHWDILWDDVMAGM